MHQSCDARDSRLVYFPLPPNYSSLAAASKSVLDVLITVNAIEAKTLRMLPLGLISRSIQGQNELWLAMALTHPAVTSLTGPQLAAFLGALLSAEVFRKPVDMVTSYSTSEAVIAAVEALEPTRRLLEELQSDAGASQSAAVAPPSHD